MKAPSSPGPRIVPDGRPPRRIAEALFPDSEIHYVAAFEAMADLLDSFDDQRPATCGAYVARYLLSPLGYAVNDGVSTTREDYLAHLRDGHRGGGGGAGRRRAGGGATARPDRRGGASCGTGRRFYAWPLRVSADPSVVGTSPTGIARIIATVSGGSLVTLPLPARDATGTIRLTEDAWDGLLDLLTKRLADWRIHAIANYESDHLLDPTSPAYQAPALTSADPAAVIPLDGWGVGHFAGIGAVWRATDGRRWVLLLDTYRDRGFSRYEPQPAELLRRALVRSDGRDGGLLLVVARAHLAAATAAVEALGLEVRMWGNGSSEPEGWAWAPGR